MLCRARSSEFSNNVIASSLSARRASPHLPLAFSCLRHTRHFSFTPPRHFPSQTTPRQVSIFLPHESLKFKAATAAASDTSIIADHYDLASYIRFHKARCNAQTDPDKRHRLSQSSVYLGTRYEYLIKRHLESYLGFCLTRTGGKGDGGVDLIGTWKVPGSSGGHGGRNNAETFKVLLQAKRLAPHRKPMPALMRELEGTIIGSPSSRALQEAFAAHQIRIGRLQTRSQPSPPPPSSLSNPSNNTTTEPEPELETTSSKSPETTDLPLPTLGILITTRPLTDGIEKAMASSGRCLMYMCLEESVPISITHSNRIILSPHSGDRQVDSARGATHANTHTGTESGLEFVPSTRIRQIAWNAAAARAGLEGYDVATKYSDAGVDREGEAAISSEATLMYQGRPVYFP